MDAKVTWKHEGLQLNATADTGGNIPLASGLDQGAEGFRQGLLQVKKKLDQGDAGDARRACQNLQVAQQKHAVQKLPAHQP